MCLNGKKMEYNWQTALMFPKIFNLPFLHVPQFYVQKQKKDQVVDVIYIKQGKPQWCVSNPYTPN